VGVWHLKSAYFRTGSAMRLSIRSPNGFGGIGAAEMPQAGYRGEGARLSYKLKAGRTCKMSADRLGRIVCKRPAGERKPSHAVLTFRRSSNVLLHASSASANVLNGEPTILIAGLFSWSKRHEAT
jgi:hypothetical protein